MTIGMRDGYHYELNARPCRMCARGDCPQCTRAHRDQRMRMVGVVPTGKPEMWLLCPHCDDITTPVTPLEAQP